MQGGERVVDIGCGPGVTLEYLPNDVEYSGFDISENYIRTARQKFPGKTFLVGTAQDFIDNDPSRLNAADLIICNGLLHHLNDDEAIDVLQLARSMLKPGGRLVCLEAVYLVRQTWISKWIISKDRGRYIRSEREWKDLTSRVFNSYSTNIVTGLIRIPYVHIIIECFREHLAGGQD